MRLFPLGSTIRLTMLLGAGCVGVTTAAAQDPALVVVSGRVQDVASELPVEGALVRVVETGEGALSDRNGNFQLPAVPPGTYSLVVQRIGFLTWQHSEIEFREGRSLIVPMVAQPIVLEGVRVTASSLTTRRRYAPFAVQAYEQRELWGTGSMHALDYLRLRAGISLQRCRDHRIGCIQWRRQIISPSVYVDDKPLFDGVTGLANWSVYDLYAIEVYRAGTVIYVYTSHYIEKLAREGRTPPPVIFW